MNVPENPFALIAEMISPDPPDWLPIALERFHPGMADGWPDIGNVLEKMLDAIDLLIRFLPIFENLPCGLAGECPNARAAINLLRSLRPVIERSIPEKRKGGPRPEAGKLICSIVMLEAWTAANGSVEPFSFEFRKATAAYWEVCGGKSLGDPTHWNYHIKNALAENREVFRAIIDILCK